MALMDLSKRRACSIVIRFTYMLILMIVIQGGLGNLHPEADVGNWKYATGRTLYVNNNTISTDDLVRNNGDSPEFCFPGVIFTIFIIIAFSAEKKYAHTENYRLATSTEYRLQRGVTSTPQGTIARATPIIHRPRTAETIIMIIATTHSQVGIFLHGTGNYNIITSSELDHEPCKRCSRFIEK